MTRAVSRCRWCQRVCLLQVPLPGLVDAALCRPVSVADFMRDFEARHVSATYPPPPHPAPDGQGRAHAAASGDLQAPGHLQRLSRGPEAPTPSPQFARTVGEASRGAQAPGEEQQRGAGAPTQQAAETMTVKVEEQQRGARAPVQQADEKIIIAFRNEQRVDTKFKVYTHQAGLPCVPISPGHHPPVAHQKPIAPWV
jgi:hypothetical protein